MKKVILIISFLLFIMSCDNADTSSKEHIPSVIEIDQVEIVSSTTDIIPIVETIAEVIKYNFDILDEEVIFSDLEDIDIPDKTFAIVASHKSMLLPFIELKNNSDLDNLSSGTKIEIGSIITISKQIYNTTPDTGNLFLYQEDYNYFYKTTIDGVEGIVWGADLLVDIKSRENAKKLSYYYTKESKTQNFLKYNGKYNLNDKIQSELIESRLSFNKVNPNEFHLSLENPDEMISLYKKDAEQRDNTLFITTDYIIHSLHLTFNNFLQTIEEESLKNKLEEFVNSYLIELEENISDLDKDNYKTLMAYEDLYNYFKVAQILLNYDDQRMKINELLLNQNQVVKDEVTKILDANGISVSPIFKYNEDYSQYIPRGHYTKNDDLTSYFLTMMWFSRMNFNIDLEKIDSTRRMLLVNKIAVENGSLLELWGSVFNPITYLIGRSDDLNYNHTISTLDSNKLGYFEVWLNKDENITEYINENISTFPKPLVSENSVFNSPSPDQKNPPLGFKIFGSRFTYDSFIHMNLSAPRVEKRLWVTGLDIMASFGSKSAISLITQKESDQVYWEDYIGKLKQFRDFFDKQDDSFWNESFYNRYLHLIKSITNFEQSNNFYFTQKGKWNQKALNASHGAWAELRHDTILYVKQAFAEMGGGGDWEPTFRTIPYLRPIHYVEPNLEFFEVLNRSIKEIMDNIEQYELDDSYTDKFLKLLEISTNLKNIVQLEINNEPISEEQNDYIVNISNILARVVLHSDVGMGDYGDTDNLKMPVVADVYTMGDEGKVLEIGSGLPNRMFIALSDGVGGKRIATGYVYTYYEFTKPMAERMNNEEWKELIYQENEDYQDWKPFWAKAYLK